MHLSNTCCSISVPTGAKEARLRWDVAKSQEGWYLAIDDVKVTAIPLLAAPVALSLPLLEPFNDRSQMTLSHNFGGDGAYDYFGISNGDNSDFGDGSATPRSYEGRSMGGASSQYRTRINRLRFHCPRRETNIG